jgi:hypothetical protein
MSSSISSEVISLGHLISATPQFVIPPFQRNYAWERTHYGALWEDLLCTFKDGGGDYFLGSAVLTPLEGRDGVLSVIDGQQRLTTIIIMLAALRNHLIRNGEEALGRQIEHEFLLTEDENGAPAPKVILNRLNQRIYLEYVHQNTSAKTVKLALQQYKLSNTFPRSNLTLLECYLFMVNRIGRKAQDKKQLLSVTERIVNSLNTKINIIKITAKDDQYAFVLFETLNERGLELSQFDIIKNYLLGLTRPRHREALAQWQEIEDNMKSQPISGFMRQHAIAQGRQITERQLFACLKAEVTDGQTARRYIRGLRHAAIHNAALQDDSHPFWGEFEAEEQREIRAIIEEIKPLRWKLMRVVLMAALEVRLEHTPAAGEFLALLKLLTDFTFRHTRVCQRAANLNCRYVKAALFVREEKCIRADEIFERFLQPLYPPDEDFKVSFQKKSSTDSALCQYVLAKLNAHLPALTLPAGVAGKPLSVEHILPRHPAKEWEPLLPAFHGDFSHYTHRLGNLTLISADRNHRMENMPFAGKKVILQEECWPLSQNLLDAEEWTAAEIEKRQAWMAEIACQVWRCP